MAHAAEPVRRNVDRDRLLQLYATMVRIRAFEDAGLAAQKQGLVLGAIHPSIGQEAVAAGICANLERSRRAPLDPPRPRPHARQGRRCHRHDVRAVRTRGGTCGGKGGSMHIADFAVGMLGANGVVVRRHADRRRRGARRSSCGARNGRCAASSATARSTAGRSWRGLNWAADLRAAGAVRVRGQRLRRDHPDCAHDRAGPAPPPAPRALGVPARRGRRQRRVAVDDRAGELARAGARRATGRSSCSRGPTGCAGHTAADPGGYRDRGRGGRRAGGRTRSAAMRAPSCARRASAATADWPRAVAAAEAEIAAAIERQGGSRARAGAQEAFTDVQDLGRTGGPERRWPMLSYGGGRPRRAGRGDAPRRPRSGRSARTSGAAACSASTRGCGRIRAGARGRHADLRGRDHGGRGRRGHDAARGRWSRCGFPTLRSARSTSWSTRPPRRATCSAARPGADGGARADRHVALLGRPALAVARSLVRACPGPGGA